MTSMELSGESGDGQQSTAAATATVIASEMTVECTEGADSSCGSLGAGQSPRTTSTTVTLHSQHSQFKDNQNRMASRHHLHSTRSQIQRNSAKLKVLGRSHAMREETSPPREPSPTTATPSPCISIITSPPPSSPKQKDYENEQVEITAQSPNPELAQCNNPIKINGSPSRVKIKVCDSEVEANEEVNYSCQTNTTISDNNDKKSLQSSPKITSKNQLLLNCDCLSQICSKCSKSIERNVNNNLRDNFNNNNNNNNVIVSGNSTLSSASANLHCSNNTLSVKAATRHKLRHQGSSQGSFEGSSSNSPCLSRDSSTEQYTDCTGIDLQQFIIDTLNKNIKDRMLMLKIEQELLNLAKDKIKTHFKFPQMSSYQRMLVHRCAAYFGMDHNIETSGKCVVVNKTKNTRIPETRFKEHIREDLLFPEEPKKSILKRDSNSFEECSGYKSPDKSICLDRKSKSFEEREEEYEKVRRRIFKDGTLQHCDSQEEFSWSEMPWPETEPSKIRLMPSEQQTRNRLLKVQSVETKSDLLRPCVAKSYSFGGYGGSVSVLSRGDSVMSTQSAGPRLLTKQDSSTSTISWRLSPSSSGYKSQSQRSDSVTPSPTATPHQLSDMSGKNSIEDATHPILEDTAYEGKKESQLIWAVTSMESVPKGSVLINPQTGQPFTNPDGTIYHFDPSNPPPGLTLPPPSPAKQPSSPQKSPMKDSATSPKKINHKTRASPAKQRSLTSSSTSPTLPTTTENATNLPIQYGNGSQLNQEAGYTNVGAGLGQEGVYNASVGVVYQPYVPTGQQYESRPESAVTQEISPYFATMAIQDPTQTYAQPTYWPQQPLYYSPTSPPQRYPLPLTAPQYSIPAAPYPSGYPTAVNTEMVPVYNPVQPVQLVYGQTGIPPQQMYMQNPMVYTGGTVAYGQTGQYPQAGTPNSSYGQYQQGYQEKGRQTQKNLKNYNQRTQPSHCPPSSNQSSGGSSSPANTVISGYYPPGTGTPMLQGAMLPHSVYRGQQCTPPETPPTHTITQSFSYPPMTYPAQQPMLVRQMSGVTASPPVSIGVRSSRSPTPAPEYPDPRSQGMHRYGAQVPQQFIQQPPPPVPQTLPIYGVPQQPMTCPVLTGNVGMLPNRSQSQSSMYKQAQQQYQQQMHQQTQQPSIYRQQSQQYQPVISHQQSQHMEQNMQRNKPKKQRSKVPSLPPSGKPSLQSIPSHSRY